MKWPSLEQILASAREENNAIWGRWCVGLLLVGYSYILVRALGWSLLNITPVDEAQTTIVTPRQISEALVMFFAGGIGSMLYAIRAYLIHASELRDFKNAYIPWYFFWPVKGAILGLIFYCTVNGGILFVTMTGPTQQPTEFNAWSLAAIGALVGLFSKYAIEKLRHVFITLFQSKDEQEMEEKYEKERNQEKHKAEIAKLRLQVAKYELKLSEIKVKKQSVVQPVPQNQNP